MTLQERYRPRHAVVRIRRGDYPVRPDCEALDGREIVTRIFWAIEDDETRGGIYRGEFAMETPRDWPIAWIASGDLEFAPGDAP